MAKILLVLACFFLTTSAWAKTPAFEGGRALGHIEALVEGGPRIMGSPGHAKARAYFKKHLQPFAGKWQEQSWEHRAASGKKYQLYNLWFRIHPKRKTRILIGSHYDTRAWADKDPFTPKAAMPGANDGASGVAVMLELARLLERAPLKNIAVDFVFFDGEEGEPEQKAAWHPIGSYRLAKELKKYYPQHNPKLALIPDLVCDKDLQLYQENFSLKSAQWAVLELWSIGKELHPGFIPRPKYSIYDDHSALIAKGIPSVVLIDFDYPVFHTVKDLPDQCSVKSLYAVGEAIWRYLNRLDQREKK